ncbi:glucokinase [Oxalobacteraceae bacterium CAVE-383]|nr:glucokinase [Oxalobacteraceae bacterium CAVE-383]
MSSLPAQKSSSAALPAYTDGPRLLGDVGGTNARFALEYAPGRFDAVQTLHGGDYAEFAMAVEAYLAANAHPPIRHAAIAMANPVQGDWIKMTNHDWAFSIRDTRRRLALETLLIVNDFTALSMSLPHLPPSDFVQVGGGAAQKEAVIGLVGPGTGLGVGGLIPDKGRWIALGSEGGHASFSPADEREVALLAYCWRKYAHVSAERLVSGPGMETVYLALGELRQAGAVAPLSTAEIVEHALKRNDPLCRETLDCFCGLLGTVASNVALTLGALGGVYLGGGVLQHLGDYFAASPFRKRFENKGRFEAYLQRIPTFMIVAQYPAFAGASAILSEHLASGSRDAIPFVHKASAQA